MQREPFTSVGVYRIGVLPVVRSSYIENLRAPNQEGLPAFVRVRVSLLRMPVFIGACAPALLPWTHVCSSRVHSMFISPMHGSDLV